MMIIFDNSTDANITKQECIKAINKQVLYRKPPNISPGLILVRKPFLMGLYTGGGLTYGRNLVLP